LWSCVGCSASADRDASGGGPVVYPLPGPFAPRPSENWSVPPLEAETVMRSCELRTKFQWDAGGGVTGARKVALQSPDLGRQFLAKWKAAPPRLESWNNSPRREIAAYAVQKLFLDPEDYIVPPSVMRCAPLDDYRAVIDASAKPTWPGVECVLGNLSLWMENVKVPDVLYDEERFATDPNYATRMADFNLLAFIIDHKDARRGNVLVSKDEADRRVFSIDNGISFDAWVWNYFVRNWNDIRVPALRKKSIDRLRDVKPEEVEALAVLAELRLMPNRILEPVAHSAPMSKTKGARRDGDVVQFGLMADEVDDVMEQIEEVIEAVDDGEIPVF
jgi:hypothetical protein